MIDDDKNFRLPNSYETSIISRLLDENFAGHTQLQEQFKNCKVKVLDQEGSLEFSISKSAPKAEIESTVPVEAEYDDNDTTASFAPKVHLLIHVKNGLLRFLDIYKDDHSPIRREAKVDELTIFCRDSSKSPDEIWKSWLPDSQS